VNQPANERDIIGATLEDLDRHPASAAAHAQGDFDRPVAVPPSIALGETEIAPLKPAQSLVEPPSASPSGSRQARAPVSGSLRSLSPADRQRFMPSLGFIRFQIRTARAPRRLRFGLPQPASTWLVVRVVKSERIGGGQPRQRLVQYLGAIQWNDIPDHSARNKFWKRADVRLKGFTPEARERFERAIEARIPRSTAVYPPQYRRSDKPTEMEARLLAALPAGWRLLHYWSGTYSHAVLAYLPTTRDPGVANDLAPPPPRRLCIEVSNSEQETPLVAFAQGWTVLRFTDAQVLDDLAGCVATVLAAVATPLITGAA
jgi:hypothetical protein